MTRAKSKDPTVTTCTTCGAEIFFVKTKAGKTVPLNAKAERRYVEDADGVWHLLKTYVTHFVTCPQADKHRKR